MSDKKELTESELDAVSGGQAQVRIEEDSAIAAPRSNVAKLAPPGPTYRAIGKPDQFRAPTKPARVIKPKPQQRAATPKSNISFKKMKK